MIAAAHASTPTKPNASWREQAACRSDDVDPETFFPAAEYGPEYDAQVAVAKAVCTRCPVRAACLDEALRRIPYGIAGGLTPEERRGRGTPSAENAASVALARGLRPDARPGEVREAGYVLLTAGRPISEVAARCRVTPDTVRRWHRRRPPIAEEHDACNSVLISPCPATPSTQRGPQES